MGEVFKCREYNQIFLDNSSFLSTFGACVCMHLLFFVYS